MKNLIVFLFICFAFTLNAQDEIPFTVQVSSDSILLGNSFEVKFQVENAKLKDFEPPVFNGFDIVGGPNQSSSMSIVNGETTQSMSFGYVLMPQEVGNYFIEPASASIDGTLMETKAIEIIVLPNPDGIQQNSRLNNRQEFRLFQDDFFSSPNAQPKPKKKTKKKLKTYKI